MDFNFPSKMLNSHNNIYLGMKNNTKHRLPLKLLSLKQKLSALFFQRLVLNEQGSDTSSDVIEYDHHCEGAEIILDFYKTRRQSTLLKAFSAVRQHQPQIYRPATKKAVNTTTRRTYLNSTLSDASPIRQINSRAVRTQKGDSSRVDLNESRLNNSTVDMKKLLDRVKMVNSRHQYSYSFREAPATYYEAEIRQNNSYYGQCLQPQGLYTPMNTRMRTNPTISAYNHYESQVLSKKSSRRQFIMSKFSRIQNTLHILGDQKTKSKISSEIMGQIHSIKERLRL